MANSPDSTDLEKELAVLAGAFRERLPERMAELGRLHQAICEGRDTMESTVALHRVVHSLAGSAQTFGLGLVGDAAREVERFITPITRNGTAPEGGEQVRLTRLLSALEKTVAEAGVSHAENRFATPAPTAPAQKKASGASVFLVEDDELLAQSLHASLTAEGYQVRHFSSTKRFTDAAAADPPDAVIMDMVLDGNETGTEAIAVLREACAPSPPPPAILVSASDSAETRLAAVRSGVVRYLAKPIDTDKLLRTLDNLTGQSTPEPFRVLLVDDDEDQAAWLNTRLTSAGMSIMAINDPMEAIGVIESFAPELILMDVYMPGCSGLELAAMIRQDDAYAHIPIVFLSTEHDLDKQLGAMNLGGDDFLSKSLEPSHLISALTARLGRARRVRRLNDDLAAAKAELESHHSNILSVLNQLRVGTVLTDERGRLLFLSESAIRLCGKEADEAVGREWSQCMPFDPDTIASIEKMAAKKADQRQKVAARFSTNGGRECRIEVEVRDDPQDPRRKLFLLYDVSEVHDLRQMLDEKSHFHGMLGKSHAMQQVFQQIDEVARVDWTVLIEGETGTGKELVARAIHQSSHRSAGPFVAVNCAGLTDSVLTSQLFGHKKGAFTGAVADHKGLFEEAGGGTIFLDEIGDIPERVQTNLLRVLQEREIMRLGESRSRKVDVRVLVATHQDLNQAVADGRFRADLMYRIRVARVGLPPLRERAEDIPLLAAAFLARSRATSGKPVESFDNDAMRALTSHPWPGNVRELEHAVEFAVIRARGEVIYADDLPPEIQGTPPLLPLQNGADGEKERVLAAIEQVGGNRSLAARRLGISRATLYRRLSEWGVLAQNP